MKAIDISTVTIGSDPEYGAIDQNGVPTSVVGFLPGTKKEPYELNKYVSCQVDNVGAETCIPPCVNENEFVKFIMLAKIKTQTELRKLAPNLSLVSVSSQKYSDKELASDTAQMFGCEASYCVYTGNRSPRPTPEEVGNLRSFGFHVHVGFPIEEGENQVDYVQKLIRAMDITLGLPSIIIDTDTDRRKIYGNAGDLRYRMIKNILVIEYRTLGGFMHSSHNLIRYVYQQTIRAVEMVNDWKNEYESNASIIENAINTGDVELCNKLCNMFAVPIPPQYQLQFEYETCHS